MYRTAPGDKVRLECPRQVCNDLQISGDNNSSTKITSTTKNHILPHTKHYIICNWYTSIVARIALQDMSIDTNKLQRASERLAYYYGNC